MSAFLLLAVLTGAQEMVGHCVSCGDLERKCHLECIMPEKLAYDSDTGEPILGKDLTRASFFSSRESLE